MEILRQLTRLLWATLNEWTIKNEIIPTLKLSIVLMIYFCRGNGHSKKCNKMYSTRAFSKGKITISRRWQSESIGQWLETPAGDLSYCLDFSQLFDHKCIPTLTSLIIEPTWMKFSSPFTMSDLVSTRTTCWMVVLGIAHCLGLIPT